MESMDDNTNVTAVQSQKAVWLAAYFTRSKAEAQAYGTAFWLCGSD